MNEWHGDQCHSVCEALRDWLEAFFHIRIETELFLPKSNPLFKGVTMPIRRKETAWHEILND